jgi:hypothetical protein
LFHQFLGHDRAADAVGDGDRARRQGRDRVICETDPEAEPRADPEAASPDRVA